MLIRSPRGLPPTAATSVPGFLEMPQGSCCHGLCSTALLPGLSRSVAVPARTVLGFRDPGTPVTQEHGSPGSASWEQRCLLPAAHSTGREWREKHLGLESGVLGDPVPRSSTEVEGRPLPGGTAFLRESWTLSRFLATNSVWDSGRASAFSRDFFTSQTSVFASGPCCPSQSTHKLPSVTP